MTNMLIFLYILIGILTSYTIYKMYSVEWENEIRESSKSEFEHFLDSETPLLCIMALLFWPMIIGVLVLYLVFKGTKWLLDKTLGKPIERVLKKHMKND